MEELRLHGAAADRGGARSTSSSSRDRGVDREYAPIPALLAVAGLHHHLIREGTRTRVGLVLETGEPREVHHFALLIGYGVQRDQSLPRLRDARRHDPARGCSPASTTSTACKNFVKAAAKGVIKVMSKMGISTAQSYRGAQIFEAVGLRPGRDRQVLHLDAVAHRRHRHRTCIAQEVAAAPHARPSATARRAASTLPSGGQYQWRADGEYHLFNPETIHKLQHACATEATRSSRSTRARQRPVPTRSAPCAGCSSFKPGRRRCRSRKSSPVEAIVKRFKTGAMSYGSISKEAHETLAIAMNRIGGKSNTGEGGEDPERYVPLPNGDSQEQRHQAGRLGPLRRDQRLPGQRQGAADQDGAGRQARRRRPAARHQGLPLDRQGAALDAGRRPDLAAAAPRHLLDRGPRRADPRPEERQPRRRASASSWWPRSASAPSRPAWPRRTPTWCSSAATTAAPAPRR